MCCTNNKENMFGRQRVWNIHKNTNDKRSFNKSHPKPILTLILNRATTRETIGFIQISHSKAHLNYKLNNYGPHYNPQLEPHVWPVIFSLTYFKMKAQGRQQVNGINLVTAPMERPHKPIKETLPSSRR